uniref:Pentatricopeptide repeat-containing protein At5g12100, mitochondrial-like n=1 Tax=Nicotiana tabacum TaxID=4097 RepID=A0A1S4DGR8_TOBAC|nr:PREDICTED: pentatricopeptide repeat-containing protein At5g12100, mitochondrial-like [Nicotiana tabacum]
MRIDPDNQQMSRSDERLINRLKKEIIKRRDDLKKSEGAVAQLRAQWAKRTKERTQYLQQVKKEYEKTIAKLKGKMTSLEDKAAKQAEAYEIESGHCYDLLARLEDEIRHLQRQHLQDSQVLGGCSDQIRRLLIEKGRTRNKIGTIAHAIIRRCRMCEDMTHTTFMSAVMVFVKRTIYKSGLLSLYSESKLINEAKELYFMIREDKKFPSLSAFNVFLESLNSLRHYKVTLEVFDDVVSWGIRVDRFSYGKAIQSAVKLGDLGKALELLNCMRKDKLSLNDFVYNVVMGGLCKERRVGEARKLFDEMLERRVSPSKVTYNILMDGWGRWRNLIVLWKGYGFVPDGFTYSILFDGHSRRDDVSSSLALYEEAVKKGVHMNEYTSSVLLNGLCKKGKTNKAAEILKKLMENGLTPTEVLFNTILSGYCKEGNMEKAYSTIDEMEISGVKPSCITFNTMITKFCELGMMDEAKEWLR